MCGLLAACTSASTTGSGTRVESRAEEPSTAFGTPLTDGPSWAPAVRTTDGLASVATSTASGFRLHTASGDKTFVPGMNLGSTTPTHQPGELAMTAADYRRWFTDMGAMGVRAVRVYTIHPPAFYDELATYNQEHPEAPLYLVQGVYLPDESYVEPGHTLYDRAVDEAFSAELADASKAVHGDLTRAPAPGHASGTWKTDVSGWVMAWIVGVEWDPAGVQRTDRVDADAQPGHLLPGDPQRHRDRALDRPAHGRARDRRARPRHLRTHRVRQLAHRRPAPAPRRAVAPGGPASGWTPTTCSPPRRGRAAPSPASTPTPTTRTSCAGRRRCSGSVGRAAGTPTRGTSAT